MDCDTVDNLHVLHAVLILALRGDVALPHPIRNEISCNRHADSHCRSGSCGERWIDS